MSRSFRAQTVALVACVLLLASCGRVGYESFESTSDAITPGTSDAISVDPTSDASPDVVPDASSMASDASPVQPVDASTIDAFEEIRCTPPCGMGQICCQGTCYPDNPAPC